MLWGRTHLVLLNRVKSDMLIVLDNHAFVFALKVANHNQTLADPRTVAGWLNMALALPDLTHIHMTIAIETGINKIALIMNNFLMRY